MIGSVEYFPLAGRECVAYLPPEARVRPLPVAVTLAGGAFHRQLQAVLADVEPAVAAGRCRPFILVTFSPVSWNRDYSPWPAPALGKTGEAFAGGAAATLKFIENELLPAMDQWFRLLPGPQNRMLLGYSLGGLMALWAAYQTDSFGLVASCSGSLWYDGWRDYMETHHPKPGCRIYLSLGRDEEKTRSKRMHTVGENTRTADWLFNQDANVARHVLQINAGGHFDNVNRRLADALLWMNAY